MNDKYKNFYFNIIIETSGFIRIKVRLESVKKNANFSHFYLTSILFCKFTALSGVQNISNAYYFNLTTKILQCMS